MIGLDFKNLKNKLGLTETPIVLRVTMMGGVVQASHRYWHRWLITCKQFWRIQIST